MPAGKWCLDCGDDVPRNKIACLCGAHWLRPGGSYICREKPENGRGEWATRNADLYNSLLGKEIKSADTNKSIGSYPNWISNKVVDSNGQLQQIWFHYEWLENWVAVDSNACSCARGASCTCGAFQREQEAKGLVYNRWTKFWYDPTKRR